MLCSASLTFYSESKGFLICNENRRYEYNNPHRMALYHPIGGKIQENETPTECAIREFIEETGYLLEINTLKLLISESMIFKDIQVSEYGPIKCHRFYICDRFNLEAD